MASQKGKKHYTSGEFARLCGTTKETLRHYDEVGILKPAEVGAKLFIDDLKITKVAKEAINNGALDGSFERVYDGKLVNWVSGSTDNGILALAGDKAHEGESSLQFTSPTTTLGKYQQVTSNVIELKPNTTYDLSYYVKNKDLEGATGYVSLVKENGEFVEAED